MWIKTTNTVGEQVLFNWDCVTHMESSMDFRGNYYTFLGLTGGQFVRTYTKLEEFTSLLGDITAIGGPTNED